MNNFVELIERKVNYIHETQYIKLFKSVEKKNGNKTTIEHIIYKYGSMFIFLWHVIRKTWKIRQV